MFAWLFLAFLFLFLLRIVAADMQPTRGEKLFYLLLGTGLLLVEICTNGVSWLAVKVNNGLGTLPIIDYPLCSLISMGIVWLLFSIIPSWREEDKMKPGKPIKTLIKKVPVLVIIVVAFLVGAGMQSWQWHMNSLKNVQANLNAIEIEKAVTTAKEQFREEIRKEETQKFLTNLQNGPKTLCTKQVYLRITEPGQEIKIFANGCGMINQLRVFRGKPTQVIVNVPEKFYVQVQMNGIDSNLYGYLVQRGPAPIIKATWPKGESLPIPQLVF